MKTLFHNRIEAGRLLVAQLAGYAGQGGVVVCGLPRGGVVVAAEVARGLQAPLEVLLVRKLGLPCQPELAMGAIAPDGVCVLNEEVIDRLGIEQDAIGAVQLHEQREMERCERLYRGGRPALALRSHTVIVVDDGSTTGLSLHAAIVYLHRQDVGRLVVAAPVIAAGAWRRLRSLASEVVALSVPDHSRNVAEWFEDFPPTTDDEVRRLLADDETRRLAPRDTSGWSAP